MKVWIVLLKTTNTSDILAVVESKEFAEQLADGYKKYADMLLEKRQLNIQGGFAFFAVEEHEVHGVGETGVYCGTKIIWKNTQQS